VIVSGRVVASKVIQMAAAGPDLFCKYWTVKLVGAANIA